MRECVTKRRAERSGLSSRALQAVCGISFSLSLLLLSSLGKVISRGETLPRDDECSRLQFCIIRTQPLATTRSASFRRGCRVDSEFIWIRLLFILFLLFNRSQVN